MSFNGVVKDAVETLQRDAIYFTIDDIVEEIAWHHAGYEDWQDIVANRDDSAAKFLYKDLRDSVIKELPEEMKGEE